MKTSLSDDSILNAILRERMIVRSAEGSTVSEIDEEDQIRHYGRKMLRLRKQGKIHENMSDQQICSMLLPAGLVGWLVSKLVWTIGEKLILWMVSRIREKVW